jgi:signal transduction histidine kinase/ActR/RegA family two-component response regulator
MTTADRLETELTVAIFAPTGRDAELSLQVLRDAGVQCRPCLDAAELLCIVEQGAGALLLAEEALQGQVLDNLMDALQSQPAWSDLPLIVFALAGTGLERILARLGAHVNVTVLERPASIQSLVSVVRAALRSRRRQYEVRDLLNRLATVDRRKDEFLAMLGHELRNPLAAIRTATDLLMSRDDAQIRRPLHVIERQASSLTRMVDDLLDVSRIRRGKITLQRTPTSLVDIARAARDSVADAVHLRRQQLELVEPHADVVVEGDPVRLEQVASNLLHNAIKYTPEGGWIQIDVRREGSDALLIVRDNGIGIDANALEDIFQPFRQLTRSLDRGAGGIGLGLPLVRHLVELHGGHVAAQSAGPDRGATFTVRMPASQAPAKHKPSASPLRAEQRHARVLLVEDNLDLAAMLREILEALGHRVEVANDGMSGIEAARRNPPDVALIDIGLPGLDGYAVAHELRQCPELARTTLIAITGYGQPEDRRRAFDAGFHDHLVKPVGASDLRRLLDRPVPRA